MSCKEKMLHWSDMFCCVAQQQHKLSLPNQMTRHLATLSISIHTTPPELEFQYCMIFALWVLLSYTFFIIEWDGTYLKQCRINYNCPHLTVLYDGQRLLTESKLTTGLPPYFREYCNTRTPYSLRGLPRTRLCCRWLPTTSITRSTSRHNTDGATHPYPTIASL